MRGVYGDIRINADQCSEGVWSNVISVPRGGGVLNFEKKALSNT